MCKDSLYICECVCRVCVCIKVKKKGIFKVFINLKTNEKPMVNNRGRAMQRRGGNFENF